MRADGRRACRGKSQIGSCSDDGCRDLSVASARQEVVMQ